MVNADHLRKPNPWNPIADPVDLKHLGKLGEETGELCAAISRCIIQGLRNGECEPVTLKPNKEWLEDEIADVLANIELVGQHFALDKDRMAERIARKMTHLKVWHTLEHMRGE